MNFNSIGKAIKVFGKNHASEIFTGIGIVGVVSASVFAVKATPKAIKTIDELKADSENDISKKEIVKNTWKLYIPSVAIMSASIALIIASMVSSNKKNVALATICAATEETFRDYKTKVASTLGKSKTEDISDAVCEDQLKKNPVGNNEVIIVSGDTLCYDMQSKRYFRSSIEDIRRAENKINKMIFSEDYASLNDFYYEIGLDEIEVGDELGWNVNRLMDIRFSTQLAENDQPCIVVDYNESPFFGYMRI